MYVFMCVSIREYVYIHELHVFCNIVVENRGICICVCDREMVYNVLCFNVFPNECRTQINLMILSRYGYHKMALQCHRFCKKAWIFVNSMEKNIRRTNI